MNEHDTQAFFWKTKKESIKLASCLLAQVCSLKNHRV